MLLRIKNDIVMAGFKYSTRWTFVTSNCHILPGILDNREDSRKRQSTPRRLGRGW